MHVRFPIAPPANLSYAKDLFVFTRNVASSVAPLPALYVGYPAAQFSVDPPDALPAGLQLDAATGVISGAALNITEVINFTVIANNSVSFVSTHIALIVQGKES